MGGQRLRAAVGGALLAALAATGPAAAATTTPGSFCAAVAPGVTAGLIQDPELVELSGLAASRVYPGVLWANNDSGDRARLFATSESGERLGTFEVEGASATDWEDLAVGPGPGGTSSIYIGDIGDNDAARPGVTVYRVPEPSIRPDGSDSTLPGAEALEITYATGPEDAEAMFVDPITGDLFIITKQLLGNSRILHAPASELVAGTPIVMDDVGSMQIPFVEASNPNDPLGLPSTMVTAADISPDGSHVLVRTYQLLLAFDRTPDQPVEAALQGTPCQAPAVSEPQGEAVAFAADGSSYFTASEAQLAGTTDVALTRFDIAPAAPPSTSTTSTSTTSTPATSSPATSTSTTSAPVITATAAPGSTPAPAASTASPAPTSSEPTSTTPATARSGGSTAGWRLAGAAAVLVGLVAVALVRRRARRS